MATLSQQQSVGDKFAAAIYAMTQEVVAAGGASKSYKSVLALQQTWNDNKSMLSSSGIIWYALTEDGLWGSNTGKALGLLTGTTAPTKTAGIPAWYAANKDLIDSYAGSGPAPKAVVAPPPAPTAAAPWSPTSADLKVIDDLHGATYLMAQEVSSASGAARAYQYIGLFQTLWNKPETAATVNAAAKAQGLSFRWAKLTVDGMYGVNTGAALAFVTSTKTPDKTYGLVAWYMANRALIDSYAAAAEAFASTSAPAQINAAKMTPDPNSVIAQADAISQSANSGSLATQAIPSANGGSTSQGTLVAKDSFSQQANTAQVSSAGGATIGSSVAQQGTLVSSQSITPPQAIESKAAAVTEIARMAPSSSDVDFSDETVYAQKPRRDIPIFAIGAGLLVAGGVFAFMARKKRRAA